jgi:Asp-tRNA(Asn)/Glu-tRNA(Gln) amidotransferase A subunit family amidase
VRLLSSEGAAAGKLKGKTIVFKDNVMLAGVPMMNGWLRARCRRNNRSAHP